MYKKKYITIVTEIELRDAYTQLNWIQNKIDNIVSKISFTCTLPNIPENNER